MKSLTDHGSLAKVLVIPDAPPQPPPNNLTMNILTIAPIERLTDRELDFCTALAEKRARYPHRGVQARSAGQAR